MSLVYSTRAINAKADALGSLLDGGWLVLYGGTQPSSPNTPTEQEELIRVRFGRPAFSAADDGIVLAHPMTSQAATGEGKATWCRAYQANGKTVVFDGSVGTRDATVTLRSVNVSKGIVLAVTSVALTERAR